jgi:hypothetical protein
MSENGPREGTRDLPRRDPEARYRTVDEAGAAGAEYRKVAQSLRRRRAELLALAAAGGTPSTIASQYQADHPLEAPVSAREAQVALEAARAQRSSSRG